MKLKQLYAEASAIPWIAHIAPFNQQLLVLNNAGENTVLTSPGNPFNARHRANIRLAAHAVSKLLKVMEALDTLRHAVEHEGAHGRMTDAVEHAKVVLHEVNNPE